MEIYTQHFLRQKLNYIHRNPIRAGLVEDIADYPHYSYRNYQFDEEWFVKVDKSWLI
jgi:hypothetical protein